MNNKWFIFASVFLAIVLAGIITLPYIKGTLSQGNSTGMAAQPKTPAPAREIPSVVVKNMDDAEAKREKTLSGLSLPKAATIYARVVDQTGRPVPGAKALIASAMGVDAANPNIEQTSDSDGALSFATTWRMLSVTVSKPGYHDLLASNATFQYAQIAFTPPPTPDPNNPVVFVLQR